MKETGHTDITKSSLSSHDVTRPQRIVPNVVNRVTAAVVFAFTLLIYFLTQARSLSFWDCGEYITSSSILGVPHPPGNPFYIILGRFFTIFDFGLPHAQVVAFISALMSALAVMLVYLITVQLISMFEKKPWLIILAGVMASVYTAFSYTFWNNAVEAEVYAGLALILNLVIWLTLLWVEKHRNMSHQNILMLIIYVFFLGFSIHQTSLQLAPAVIFIVFYPAISKNFRTSGFWIKTGIYIALLLTVYAVFNGAAEKVQFPSLGKWMFAFTAIAMMVFHLRKDISKRTWILAIVFIAIGFSPHIYLWIRSALRPFMNEGHPHNWELFTNYILRRQYGNVSFMDRRATLLYQVDYHFLRYFSWQFFHAETIAHWVNLPVKVVRNFFNLLVVLPLGLTGIVYQIRKNRHSFAYFMAFYFMSSIAMILVSNLSTQEVRDREYFFTNAYYLWTIWMAIGCIGIIKLLWKNAKPLGYIALVLFTALPVLHVASQYHIHDRSKEFVAIGYGQNFLNSLEENAIIFTNGDNDTFPLWYAQAVNDPAAKEHIYPAEDVYPDENMKAKIAEAIEYKNEQCKGIRKDVSIANLSLLNTGWYIKQIRDKEAIEFTIPDKQIHPEVPGNVLYPTPIRRSGYINIDGQRPGQNIAIRLEAGDTSSGRFNERDILYTKHLAVIQIIKDNFGKRPIYFAVTIPDTFLRKLGLNKYLRNEGMVDRLVAINKYEFKLDAPNAKSVSILGDMNNWKPIPMEKGNDGIWRKELALRPAIYNYIYDVDGKQVADPDAEFSSILDQYGRTSSILNADFNIDRLEKNVTEIYTYRSIFDDSVYKDDNITRLVNNYGASYITRLSQYYLTINDYEKAVHYMEEGFRFIQNKDTILDNIMQLYKLTLDHYKRTGNYQKAEEILAEGLKRNPNLGEYYDLNIQMKLYIANLEETTDKQKYYDEAGTMLDKVTNVDPSYDKMLRMVIRYYKNTDDKDRALKVLNEIKPYHNKEQVEMLIENISSAE